MSKIHGTPQNPAPDDDPETSRTEREKRRVKEWNRDRLVGLGVDKHYAELAAEVGVDWHDVERLVALGCDPSLALDIAA